MTTVNGTGNGESTRPNLEFEKLNQYVSLYTPPESLVDTENPTDPTTIVFCSWMGASVRSRSLQKAFHHHHDSYPHARIIVVRCLPEWFAFTPASTRKKHIFPAVPAIESDPAGSDKRVLVHLFSNGGSVVVNDIARMYLEKYNKRLDVKAMVLDSAPGDPTVMNGWYAMTAGLPKGPLWYLGASFVILYIAFYYVTIRVLRIHSFVDVARHGLNNLDIMDKRMQRLYVYSTGDKLVEWKHVEDHAEEAKGHGMKVKMLKEEKFPHIQSMMKDEDRYWKMVKELWDGTRV